MYFIKIILLKWQRVLDIKNKCISELGYKIFVLSPKSGIKNLVPPGVIVFGRGQDSKGSDLVTD